MKPLKQVLLGATLLVIIFVPFFIQINKGVMMVEIIDHHRQVNQANFVRTHNCPVSDRIGTSSTYDSLADKVIVASGFTVYRCPDYGVTIYIHDDEVQP